MKGIKIAVLISFLIILSSLTVVVFFWWRQNTKAVSNVKATQDIIIVKGKSAGEVGQKLYEEGLIRSQLAFKIYIQLSGKADKIQSGEFRFSPNMNLFEVVNSLQKGPLELWVTIPEGLRREEVVERFASSLQMNTARAIEFRNEFLNSSSDLEGYLFPDTYLFPKDITGDRVVQRMKTVFDQKFDENMKVKIQNDARNISQVVTMASIIERETKTDAERPIVAGILWKRATTKGWLLQTDATVQYAIASKNCSKKVDCIWWPILTKDDLEYDSPYNTYKYSGIPPHPIANAGLESLKAAIYPSESDYWFYIHDGSGNIHYAKTIREHNQNISEYLGK